MSDPIPRLRMFAGPNGSGKTTVKNSLSKPASWFGVYINPDDLEKEIRATGFLYLAPFGLTATTDDVRGYFTSSAFLKSHNRAASGAAIVCRDGGIDFGGLPFDSYYASVLSDFLRRSALAAGKSFSFETVMSAEDKVVLLSEARSRGFRTYLYYVATASPRINTDRVRHRVASGGHDVPVDKIISRYHRSLALAPQAVRASDRAFFFDTSEDTSWYFAEITGGSVIDLKSNAMPDWFHPLWDELSSKV